MGPPPTLTMPVDDRGRERVPRRYRDDLGWVDPFVDEEDDDSEWPDVDLGGFPRGLSLVKMCLRIVWKDKEILLYQVSSAVISVGLLLMFLAAILPVGGLDSLEQELDNPIFYL
ncbi:MAG: hypothetical protein MUC90_00905 [Thermoplasmata archaeon]|nr:hypothetical protein [Thermoplasmata archaeon]